MDGLLDTSVVIELFGGNRKVIEGLFQVELTRSPL